MQVGGQSWVVTDASAFVSIGVHSWLFFLRQAFGRVWQNDWKKALDKRLLKSLESRRQI